MREADRKRLTWEDATERFLDVTEITAADRAKPMDAAFDTLAYTTHNLLTGAPAASDAQPPLAGRLQAWQRALQASRGAASSELPRTTPRPPRGTSSVVSCMPPARAGVEVLRAMWGAGINTRDNPQSLIDYIPVEDSGGLFDARGRQAARALKKAGAGKK